MKAGVKMAKRGSPVKNDPYAKRATETHLQWRSRVAAMEQAVRDRSEPVVPREAQRHGEYGDQFVYHLESGTKVQTKRNAISRVVDKWFEEGSVGFHHGSRLAVEWCHERWEARGTIGRLCANYEPTIPSGGNSQYARDIHIRDELDEVRSWFHPAHWEVFEGVVRWGRAAGVAGSDLADNTPQAIASAKTVVGMIASFIAAKRGY